MKTPNVVTDDVVLGFVVAHPPNGTGPSLLPEMDFLEQGDNSWPSPAVTTSPERTRATRGVKASRWTRQAAVEEVEPPDLEEGEAKVGYSDRGQQEFQRGAPPEITWSQTRLILVASVSPRERQ